MSPELQHWLIAVAKRARVYFDHQTSGHGSLNGPYDDIGIGRDLTACLHAIEDERLAQDARNATHRQELEGAKR